MVQSNSTRSNNLKHEHRKFHTNIQNNLFMVRVMEDCKKLSRDVMESPSMACDLS